MHVNEVRLSVGEFGGPLFFDEARTRELLVKAQVLQSDQLMDYMTMLELQEKEKADG